MTNSIREELDRWEKTTLNKVLSKAPEREPSFKTTSQIEIKRLYTPLDGEDMDYCRDLGFPGEYPFTRGAQPTMYRGRFWTMRQYAGFATAEETNKRYKYLLDHGQTGLSVAFDLPTQIGYDSDHPLAEGEVGKSGVAIDSLKDMEILFDGIPLDKVSTSMTINSTAAILLAMYMAVAEKQGVKAEVLQGTIQNDILKEYAARGTYIFPPLESMRITTDIFAFCNEHVPRWNTHQHQRVSHAGSRLFRCPGGRLYPGGRHCLCRSSHPCRSGCGFLRIPAVLLLQCPQQLPRRDCQIPGRSETLGQDHEGAL